MEEKDNNQHDSSKDTKKETSPIIQTEKPQDKEENKEIEEKNQTEESQSQIPPPLSKRSSKTIVRTKADKHGFSKAAELVWELNNKEMTKNEMFSKNIPLSRRGNYQLIFTKLDSIILRTLSIRVKVSQNGKHILEGKGGVGGLRWTGSHCMEFQISQPSDISISLKCCNVTSIGKIAFKIELVCTCEFLVWVVLFSFLYF